MYFLLDISFTTAIAAINWTIHDKSKTTTVKFVFPAKSKPCCDVMFLKDAYISIKKS